MIESRILLLLAARLRSRGASEEISVAFVQLGGDGEVFEGLMAAAVALDQVRVRGVESRHSLTGAGQAELAAHLLAESERVGRADLGTAYEAFLPLNRAFLAALAADATRLDLAALVAQLAPVLAALEAKLDRFAAYSTRFAAALREAEIDTAWIASPSVDSVHTIWFELHEHLLATLGRDRTQETAQETTDE